LRTTMGAKRLACSTTQPPESRQENLQLGADYDTLS
jgi:hypothetical protein